MIGVAEHDLGAGRRARSAGVIPLTVPCVPTGMKAGVCTRPCGVRISPRRAAPSVLASVEGKGAVMARRIQQTGIAIGIEAIAARDRVRIGALHRLQPDEGRHQHEQGRARQVEIGQHQVDRAEAVARRDEDRRSRRQKALQLPVLAGGAFQRAAARSCRPRRCARPWRATAFSAAATSARHCAAFGMHLVAVGVVGLHRQEGAGADMQRHLVRPTPRAVEPRQQLRREMQARGRRRDRALRLRKDGLVVGLVLLVGPRGARRYRAAAACRRARRSPGRAPGRGRKMKGLPRLPHLSVKLEHRVRRGSRPAPRCRNAAYPRPAASWRPG